MITITIRLISIDNLWQLWYEMPMVELCELSKRDWMTDRNKMGRVD